eukprot:scaffold468233_cov27-Prasinocladus_malaysianus.AAC.1
MTGLINQRNRGPTCTAWPPGTAGAAPAVRRRPSPSGARQPPSCGGQPCSVPCPPQQGSLPARAAAASLLRCWPHGALPVSACTPTKHLSNRAHKKSSETAHAMQFKKSRLQKRQLISQSEQTSNH